MATNEIGSNNSDPQCVDVASIGKKGRMKWNEKQISWRCMCFLIPEQVVVKVFFPLDVKLAMDECLSSDNLKYVSLYENYNLLINQVTTYFIVTLTWAEKFAPVSSYL